MNKIKKKILVVEDDEDFLYILEKKFTIEGFTIVAAKNGEEGVAAAEKEKPDLILSDVLMPVMDGISMAKKIREKNAAVPILFLTNVKDIDYTIEIQASRSFDYIIKADTRIDEIVAKVKLKLGIKS